MAAEQGLDSGTRRETCPYCLEMRWGGGTECTVPLAHNLLLLHCHPQSNTQFLFPAAVPINAQFDYINTVMRVSRHSPFYRLIFFFFPLFHNHSLSIGTAPSRRSNGEVSCFWSWRLWPLYYQHPLVRTMSKIYTWMQTLAFAYFTWTESPDLKSLRFRTRLYFCLCCTADFL